MRITKEKRERDIAFVSKNRRSMTIRTMAIKLDASENSIMKYIQDLEKNKWDAETIEIVKEFDYHTCIRLLPTIRPAEIKAKIEEVAC